MRKLIIPIFLLLFLVEAYSDETLYPYYCKYNNGIMEESLFTHHEFHQCHEKILLFHDLWYSFGSSPIRLEVDLLGNPSMHELPSLSRNETLYAARNAIYNWNSICYLLSNCIFEEYDYYQGNPKRILLWTIDNLENYPICGTNLNFCGQVLYFINAYNCYDVTRDIYYIDYETNTGHDGEPLEYYGTIIYLNGDPNA